MANSPADVYGTQGGTPTVKNEVSGEEGGTPIRTQANPEDYGAGLAGEVSEVAGKFVNMYNETAATNADTDYAVKLAGLTGKYKSLEGMDAVNALPQFNKDVTSLRGQYSGVLPLAAQHMFDGMTMRRQAVALGDASEYQASQLKQANDLSLVNNNNQSVADAANGNITKTIEDVGNHLGNVKYNTQVMMEGHPGIQHDPETGAATFAATPEGQAARSKYQSMLDQNQGAVWEGYLGSMANGNAIAAHDTYQLHKDAIPAPSQVNIEAMLAPKVLDQQSKIMQDGVLNDAHNDWFKIVGSPQGLADYRAQQSASSWLKDSIYYQESTNGTAKYNNVVSDGKTAVGPMQITPDTWNTFKNLGLVKSGESITNPADNKAVGDRAIDYYSGKYKNADGSVDAARVAVAYHSGAGNVSPAGSPTPYINNPQDSLRKHTADYSNEVVQRIGAQPQGTQVASTGQSPLQPPSKADYYRSHFADILQDSDERCLRDHPGQPALFNKVHAGLETFLKNQIAQDDMKNVVASHTVWGTIDKAMDEGKPFKDMDALKASSPEMADALSRIRNTDQRMYEGIEQKILPAYAAVMSKQDQVNSPHYGENLQRALLPEGDSNRLKDESEIHGLNARKDADTYINVKDSRDLRTAVSLDHNWRSAMRPLIDDIINANGNIDGKGQERAGLFFNRMMQAKDKAGENDSDLINPDKPLSAQQIAKGYQLSRMAQLANMAKSNTQVASSAPTSHPAYQEGQTATGPNGAKMIFKSGVWAAQ